MTVKDLIDMIRTEAAVQASPTSISGHLTVTLSNELIQEKSVEINYSWTLSTLSLTPHASTTGRMV